MDDCVNPTRKKELFPIYKTKREKKTNKKNKRVGEIWAFGVLILLTFGHAGKVDSHAANIPTIITYHITINFFNKKSENIKKSQFYVMHYIYIYIYFYDTQNKKRGH